MKPLNPKEQHLKLTRSHSAPVQSVFVSDYLNLVKIWHLIAFHHRRFRKLSVVQIVLPLHSVGT